MHLHKGNIDCSAIIVHSMLTQIEVFDFYDVLLESTSSVLVNTVSDI